MPFERSAKSANGWGRMPAGWEPQIGWQEGMRETVDKVRSNFDELKTLSTEFVLRA